MFTLLAFCLAMLAFNGPRLEGVVREPGGAAAAGARVVLSFQAEQPWDAPRISDQVVADADGRFALAISDEWLRRRGWKSLDLWAWNEESGLCALSLDVAEMPIGEELVLELPAASGHALTFLDPAGLPLVGAAVRLSHLGGHPVPEPAVEAFRAVTDRDGIARVRFDRARANALLIETDGFGKQMFIADGIDGWSADEPLRLFPAGLVRAEVEGEPPSGFGAASLTISTYNRVELQDGGSAQVAGMCTLPLADAPGPERPLMVGDVQRYDLAFDSTPPALPRVFPVKLSSGGSATVRLVWKDNVAVHGRVDDMEGKPVAGVKVSVFAYPAGFPVVSDAEGRLSFHVVPGALSIQSAEAPGWTAGLDRFHALTYTVPADAETFELPPLRVTNSKRSGQVLDPEGRPVSGAWVYGKHAVQTEASTHTIPVCAFADDEGRFEFEGVSPDATLEVSARHAYARTAQVMLAAPDPSEPLRLVVEDGRLLPIDARVRDAAGRAVPDAKVVFWKESPPGLIGGEREVRLAGGAQETRSDAQGRVRCGPSLTPGAHYSAVVTSPDCAPFQSPWFAAEGAAGGLVFQLELLATLSGTLRDGEGNPIASARVFVRGDAPAAVETSTDAAGRFTLPGVFARGFVLAEAPSFGTSARRYEGSQEIDWHLGALESAFAPEHTVDPARELELARELCTAGVASARAAKDENAILRAFERQARVDPGAVLAEIGSHPIETGWMNDFVRRAVVDVLQSSSPDEALTVADSMNDPWRQGLAKIAVVCSLPTEERARKLELLGAIRAIARQVEHPPHRLVLLAHVAETLLDLGERETAVAILNEGRELAANLPSEEWSGYARCVFAEQLALVDLEPALEIVATLGNADRGRHLGNIAHELAALDPAAAERVLGMLPQSGTWSPARYAPRVCYRMARADLERALALARKYGSTAESLGAMALSLADLDPASARTLLDEAFEELLRKKSGDVYPRPLHVAASLLPLARRLAPENYESKVACALAIREPRAAITRLGAVERYLQEDAALAFFVGIEDSALGRELVEPAVEHLLAQGERGRTSDWRIVYAALAQVDGERAARLCAEGFPSDASATVSSLLARSGAERTRWVQDEVLNLWVADKEDL